jgi:hypothetical protein
MLQEDSIDVDSAILPVQEILARFVTLLPAQVRAEAARPESPLFSMAVLRSLNDLHRIQGQALVSEVNKALEIAVEHLISCNLARVPLGLDIMTKVHDTSENGAKLVFATICGALRTMPKSSTRIYTDLEGESAKIYTELQVVDFVKDLLPSQNTSCEAGHIDLNLRGVTLTGLDLSDRAIGRLWLDDAVINGNLRLRHVNVVGELSMINCNVAGVVDFEGSRLNQLCRPLFLSC